MRAFARLAPTEGRRLTFTDRIPRERGLGSSAAVIALGLVAGALASGREPEPEALLAEGLPLEGHPDNLAAALAGGVCLTWAGRIARIAGGLPAVPVAVIPESAVSTAEARAALPRDVPFSDAAFSVARATILGAGLASGSAELFAAALADRLHEPHRATNAPLLAAVRAELPAGALGATLSGSGPTVIVWVREEAVAACAHELRGRFGGAQVLPLAVSEAGAATRA